jgi:hypothetical protein
LVFFGKSGVTEDDGEIVEKENMLFLETHMKEEQGFLRVVLEGSMGKVEMYFVID